MLIDEITENPVQFFLNLYRNNRTRNIILLTILVIALLVVGVYRLAQWMNLMDQGAGRVIICTKCEYREVKDIDRIKGEKCPKCKGLMGYGWKCKVCDYEYPMLPSKTKKIHLPKRQIINIEKAEKKCPNCDSLKTRPISKK